MLVILVVDIDFFLSVNLLLVCCNNIFFHFLFQISIRQQLTNWGVRKDTIDIWLANIDKKTINDAIKKTINRPND
jgi:hypothetical protein